MKPFKMYLFHSLHAQDKEFHAAAPPAAGSTGVQAQRRDEGVPERRPLAARPHRAPPLSAGPQVTEGPAGGAALRPQAGRGQGGHQGLCQINGQTSEQHRDEQGQVTGEERDAGSSTLKAVRLHGESASSRGNSGGPSPRNKPYMEDLQEGLIIEGRRISLRRFKP